VLCVNFRPDRMRQIVRTLAEPGFGEGTEELPGWRGRGGCAPIRRLAMMNGGREQPYDGERRELVPSQRDVPTYDHKPQMSARQITDAFLAAFAEDRPRFSIINYANADMVGHTGVIPAAIAGVETIDGCLPRVVEAIYEAGGVCVITADHGNADHMLEDDRSPNTAHSLNPVPLTVTARLAAQARAGAAAPHACVTPAPSVM
jgi:bisphosphoglycerate-independent phosphoglycerate mutase (AlkP superfamily)